MEYKIRSDIFWNSTDLIGLYFEKAGKDWHLIDEKAQKVTRTLGMEFIVSTYGSNLTDDRIFYCFKIINKEKFLWGKLKYGY